MTGYSIPLEGSSMSVSDLKLAIRAKCGITNCDLSLTLKEDTKEKVCNDNELISAYSHLIVRRLPIANIQKNQRHSKTINPENFNKNDPYKNMNDKHVGHILKNINLATSDMTEDEKLDKVVEVSNNYNYAGKKLLTGYPPSNYTCNKCGIPGHWISQCPGVPDKNGKLLNSREVKRPSGIPNTNLREVDETTPNSYLTAEGRYVVNIKNHEAFLKGKKEKRPFSIEENPPMPTENEEEIPAILKCNLCMKLLTKPVKTPCCGSAYCESCITDHLFVADENGAVHKCPNCNGKVDKLDSLRDASSLMNLVNEFVRGKLSKSKLAEDEVAVKIEQKTIEEPPKKAQEMTDDDLLNEIFYMNDKENDCPGKGGVVVGYQHESSEMKVESVVKNEMEVKPLLASQSDDALTTEVLKQLANRGQVDIQQFIKTNPDFVEIIQGIVKTIQPVEPNKPEPRARSRSRQRYEGRRGGNNQSASTTHYRDRHDRHRERPTEHQGKHYKGDEYSHRRQVDDRRPHRSNVRSKDEWVDSRQRYAVKREDHESERDQKHRSSHRRSPDDHRMKLKRSYEKSNQNDVEKGVDEFPIKREKSYRKSVEQDETRCDRSKMIYNDRKTTNTHSKSRENRGEHKEITADNFIDQPNTTIPYKERDTLPKQHRSRSRSAVRSVNESDREIKPQPDDGDCQVVREKKSKHKKSKKSKKSKLKHSDKKKPKKSKHLSD